MSKSRLIISVDDKKLEEAIRILDTETSAQIIREIEDRGENAMERVNEACNLGAEALRYIQSIKK